MTQLVRRPDWSLLDWPERFPHFPERLSRLFERPDLFPSRFGYHMNVEEYRENGAMVVRAELPGIDPDKDVEITVTEGMLDITAERKQEAKTGEKEHYRSEFCYGMFHHTLSLPVGASEADVKASYHDGILEVRVPIEEAKAETKKVPIERT